jgi:hypothetical protein
VATVVFFVTKFAAGAWVLVVVVPLLLLLFTRIETYYERAGRILEIGHIPPPPRAKRTVVVVPVTNVSRLTRHALSEALSLGDEVVAVTVVLEGEIGSGLSHPDIEDEWRRWHPGVKLRVLHTNYASIVRPIVRMVDELRHADDCQVVVLIPVVIPGRLRYRLLHNQVDLALAAELRRRPDVVVARVPMPIAPTT